MDYFWNVCSKWKVLFIYLLFLKRCTRNTQFGLWLLKVESPIFLVIVFQVSTGKGDEGVSAQPAQPSSFFFLEDPLRHGKRTVAGFQGQYFSHRLKHPLDEASLPSHRDPEPWTPVTISSFSSLSNRINSPSTKVLWRATKWHDSHIQVWLYCKSQENHLYPYSWKALKSFWGMKWGFRHREIYLVSKTLGASWCSLCYL